MTRRIFLVAVLLFAGVSALMGTPASAGEKLKIVTTIFPQYDFVREIAGGESDQWVRNILDSMPQKSKDR